MTIKHVNLDIDDINRWGNLPDFYQKLSEVTFECSFDMLEISPVFTPAIGTFLILETPSIGARFFIGRHEVTTSCTRISAHIYRVDTSILNDIDEFTTFTVISFKPDYYSYGPIKLIDKENNTQVTTVSPYDPVNNWFPPSAANDVDIWDKEDPSYVNPNLWMDDKIGTVWADTSKMQYLPYYDKRYYSNVSEQLSNWGRLADWGEVAIYQWTKSYRSPLEYNQAAIMEEGDTSIPINERASGKVKRGLFFNGVAVSPMDLQVDFWALQGIPSLTDFMLYADPGDVNSSPPYIEVYINGQYNATQVLTDFINDFNNTGKYNASDHIHLQRSLVDLDTGENYPWVQITEDSITRTELNESGEVQTVYYFWVEQKTIPQHNSTLSLTEIRNEIVSPSSPYFFFEGFSFARDLSDHEKMTKLYVRNLKQYINDFNRYLLKLPVDQDRRDVVRQYDESKKTKFETETIVYEKGKYLNKKSTEWRLFRLNDQSLIPRELWIKLIESCIGVRYYDFTEQGDMVPLPRPYITRFDDVKNTNYSYGITKDQVMAPRDVLLNTILETIRQPLFDTYPRDKFEFISKYSFDVDTPLSVIIEGLDVVYETFNTSSVNQMFFNCLYVMLSYSDDVANIMKTSLLAIHGIKLLETATPVSQPMSIINGTTQ